MLRIEPGLLLGPHQPKRVGTYTNPESPDLPQLIRSRLPPRVKILLLESVTSARNVDDGLDQVIFDKDLELMRCLLEHRDAVAPKLTRLWMYYLENMVNPMDLYALAKRVGVRMCGLYESDDFEIDDAWLDQDEDP